MVSARVVDGVEASRRVGWAKYYGEKASREALRDENSRLRWMVRLLARRILLHSRLSGDDDLVVLARELERAL